MKLFTVRERECEAWFQRKCAGILKRAYELASESENPFYSMTYLQAHYKNEIFQLKEQLTSRLTDVSSQQSAKHTTMIVTLI